MTTAPKLAPAQHIVADGDLPVGEGGVHTLVDTLIAAADESDLIEGGEFPGHVLIERWPCAESKMMDCFAFPEMRSARAAKSSVSRQAKIVPV